MEALLRYCLARKPRTQILYPHNPGAVCHRIEKRIRTPYMHVARREHFYSQLQSLGIEFSDASQDVCDFVESEPHGTEPTRNMQIQTLLEEGFAKPKSMNEQGNLQNAEISNPAQENRWAHAKIVPYVIGARCLQRWTQAMCGTCIHPRASQMDACDAWCTNNGPRLGLNGLHLQELCKSPFHRSPHDVLVLHSHGHGLRRRHVGFFAPLGLSSAQAHTQVGDA